MENKTLDRDIVELSTQDIQAMSRLELLEAVQTAESLYGGRETDFERDHRRHLRRDELEHVFFLVQHLVRRRASAIAK